MAEKTLNTRVILKHDSLANWNSSTLALKEGEIALAYVETTKPDGHGGSYTIPTYLMKVGVEGKKFSELEWLAAPASDVYAWAKLENPTIDELPGNLKTAITNLQSAVGDGGSVAETIANAINALDSTVTGEGTIVKSVVQTDGKVAVEMGKLSADEIPELAIGKITGLQDALDGKSDDDHKHVVADITDFDTEVKKYDYATKAEAKGYADAKDEAIAAAKKAGDDAQAGVDTLVGDVAGDDAMSVREIASVVTNSGIGSLALSVEKRTVGDVNKDYIVLRAGEGEAKVEIASLDATTFVKDGMLDSVVLNDGNDLVFTFNTDAGKDKITIPLDEFIDVYTAGTGIDIIGNVVSLTNDSQTKLNMAHSHSNKNVLDGITADKVTAWDGAVDDKDKYIAADTALKAELIGTEDDDTAKISIYGARAFASDAAITATTEANEYTDDEIGKLLGDGGQVKINADAIEAINDEENGILAQAKAYAESLTDEDTKYTAAADGGLKLDPTNNAFSIDDTVTFILDCGGSGVTA